MTEVVIDFTDTGIESMYFDRFNLGFLGRMTVIRASEIFFNHDTQLWSILLPGQETPYPSVTGFLSYDDARSFEVDWLTECRKEGVNPLTNEGEQCATALRSLTLQP